MTEKKLINLDLSNNSFELSLRILGNEFVAIKIGSTNFSGKLIAGGILLLFFTLIYLMHNAIINCICMIAMGMDGMALF